MFVIIDCYLKFCWCYIIKLKSPKQLINCYEHLFNYFKQNICGGIWKKQLIVKSSVICLKIKILNYTIHIQNKNY